jgi:hypothetical protein
VQSDIVEGIDPGFGVYFEVYLPPKKELSFILRYGREARVEESKQK